MRNFIRFLMAQIAALRMALDRDLGALKPATGGCRNCADSTGSPSPERKPVEMTQELDDD